VTAPAEALADPVGTVVSLVTAADPALGHDLVRRVIEQVGGGRSKRRRLAAELAGDPSVLTTGQSPASKVTGDAAGRRRDRDLAAMVRGLRAPRHLDAAPGRALVLRVLLCPPGGLRGLREHAAGRVPRPAGPAALQQVP